MIRFYIDEQFHAAITQGLRDRGVDCLTVQEDGRSGVRDGAVLDRASELGRVVVSFDADMLRHTTDRLKRGVAFAGLVHGHPLGVSIGDAVRDLTFLANEARDEDMANTVWHLPL